MGGIDIVEPAGGRYITEGDDESRALVTMIGSELATKLFPNVDPIGREILIDGRPFEVVGIAKPIGSVLGQSQDNFAYIPIQTYFKIYGSYDGIWINIQARGAEWMERTQDETRALMRARRHLPPNEKDNFGIFDSATLMDLWKNLTGVIATAMVGVVSVFLVIGGVVIMNVMLAAVTERIARNRHPQSFGRAPRHPAAIYGRAAVMAAVGGAIGVALAYLISGLTTATTSVPMSVASAVLIAEVISAAVGVFLALSCKESRGPATDRSAAPGTLGVSGMISAFPGTRSAVERHREGTTLQVAEDFSLCHSERVCGVRNLSFPGVCSGHFCDVMREGYDFSRAANRAKIDKALAAKGRGTNCVALGVIEDGHAYQRKRANGTHHIA
jgi:hypothetical protein